MPAAKTIYTTIFTSMVCFSTMAILPSTVNADDEIRCYGVSIKCNDQTECGGEDYVMMTRERCKEAGGNEG